MLDRETFLEAFDVPEHLLEEFAACGGTEVDKAGVPDPGVGVVAPAVAVGDEGVVAGLEDAEEGTAFAGAVVLVVLADLTPIHLKHVIIKREYIHVEGNITDLEERTIPPFLRSDNETELSQLQ